MPQKTVLSVEECNAQLLNEAQWLLEQIIIPNLDTACFTLEDIQSDTHRSRIPTVYREEHLEVLVDRGCIADNEDGTFSILCTDWDFDQVIDADVDDDLFLTNGNLTDANCRRSCADYYKQWIV